MQVRHEDAAEAGVEEDRRPGAREDLRPTRTSRRPRQVRARSPRGRSTVLPLLLSRRQNRRRRRRQLRPPRRRHLPPNHLNSSSLRQSRRQCQHSRQSRRRHLQLNKPSRWRHPPQNPLRQSPLHNPLPNLLKPLPQNPLPQKPPPLLRQNPLQQNLRPKGLPNLQRQSPRLRLRPNPQGRQPPSLLLPSLQLRVPRNLRHREPPSPLPLPKGLPSRLPQSPRRLRQLPTRRDRQRHPAALRARWTRSRPRPRPPRRRPPKLVLSSRATWEASSRASSKLPVYWIDRPVVEHWTTQATNITTTTYTPKPLYCIHVFVSSASTIPLYSQTQPADLIKGRTDRVDRYV